jgi:hypothetical protein
MRSDSEQAEGIQHMNKKLKASLLTLICAASPALMMTSQAHAWTTLAAGHVMTIETSYMPDGIVFTSDVAAPGCAAGTLVTYVSQQTDPTLRRAAVQAAYQALLAALLSGRRVTVQLDANTCTGKLLTLQ